MSYKEQVKRIKSKLISAKEKDSQLKVFGAKSHKYVIGNCLSESEIGAFEEKYNLKLPESYRTFLLEIGNGGLSFQGSAAGPFYGIYPLGTYLDELVELPEKCLSNPPRVTPQTSDEEWEEICSKIVDDMSDDDYEQVRRNIYAGIMPLGSQGCTYLHALIVSGEYSGKVINVDLEFYKPRFCFEDHFLDWYERWLDEIISDQLLVDGPTWFGYKMGGDTKHLLTVFDQATEHQLQIEALEGLRSLVSVDEECCKKLAKVALKSNQETAHVAAQLLIKFSYPKSKKLISDLINGSDLDCLMACQGLFWYQRKHAIDWLDHLNTRLKTVENEETFRFITYLLEECRIDYGPHLIPVIENKNAKIKQHVFYMLGKLKNKRKYLDALRLGLHDESSHIVHTTLQAIKGVNDSSLLSDYFHVIQQYPKEKNHVLINLKHRLNEQGFSSQADFLERYDPESDTVKVKYGWLHMVYKMFFKGQKK